MIAASVPATLANGASVVNGQTYEISFRARWITGNNLLNTRLYFNRVARTTALPVCMTRLAMRPAKSF